MSMIFTEAELSSASLRKLLAAPQLGRRYILLDSVRDSGFLSSNTIINPDGSHDGGLGVVDNGIFFYTTKFVPGNPTTPRQYPVKFFWIGSPAGTNDANDTFSIYVADVNRDAFYPGAVASVWLVNPRLALHWTQAKTDIINWFDANYPGGASGGVGSTGTGSNSQYGTLDGDNSHPGNVSGMTSIDGQFWPIYDHQDDTILLYFSIKTPNANTKSIYAYKITDTEIGSPANSSEFLGGIVGNQAISALGASGVMSSHRFSIISPDPIALNAKATGQQSAIVAHSYGVFDTATPDHGRWMACFQLSDVHRSPINWTQANYLTTRIGLDVGGIYNVDKLGSIQPVSSGEAHVEAPYSILFNSVSSRDIRAKANSVVIDAMQIRISYWHAASVSCFHGSRPIIPQGEIENIGHCRPQFTHLPDGLPKVLMNGFGFDQHLQIQYQYVERDEIQPERQPALVYSVDDIPNPFTFPSYGKKKAKLRLFASSILNSGNPQAQSSVAQVATATNLTASQGFYYLTAYDIGYLIPLKQVSPYSYSGTKNNSNLSLILDETFQDLSPYTRIRLLRYPSNVAIFGTVELS